MRTITIKDLEMSKVLDKKSMANLRGGLANNVGYETNNAAPRGAIYTSPTPVRTAILGIYTRANGRHERMVQDVYIRQEEFGGSIRFEPLAY